MSKHFLRRRKQWVDYSTLDYSIRSFDLHVGRELKNLNVNKTTLY